MRKPDFAEALLPDGGGTDECGGPARPFGMGGAEAVRARRAAGGQRFAAMFKRSFAA